MGKKRTFRSELGLVDKPDPTEAGSVGITRETAEPIPFSPAEPVDYLRSRASDLGFRTMVAARGKGNIMQGAAPRQVVKSPRTE